MQISETIVECAAGVPTKASIYGTVIGLLNTDTYEWVGGLVERTRQVLVEALAAGQTFRCRALCRLWSVLVLTDVVSPAALARTFLEFTELAIACQSEGRHESADAVAGFVVSGLPIAEHEVARRAPEEYAALVAALERYMGGRPSPVKAARVGCQIISGDKGVMRLAMEDILEKLRAAGGATVPSGEQQEPQGARIFERVFDDFKMHLEKAQQHDIASLGVAAADVPQLPQGRWTYSLLPPTKTACGLCPSDRALMEELVLDSLESFNGWKPELVGELVHLQCPEPSHFLLAEVLLGQMLALPRPAFPEVFYGTVMMELCKALPQTFPKALLTTANVLFLRMTKLDVECRERLAIWLAHHMSNFKFGWAWDSWMDVTEQDSLHPQRMFVEQTLGALVRLSYYEHTQKCIPEQLHALLPPEPLPAFAYADGGGAPPELCAAAQEMVNKVRSKATAEDLLEWLQGTVAEAHGASAAAAVAVQTLLKLGAASLSHTTILLDRYKETLVGICSAADERASAMAATARFWAAAPQQLVFATSKLLDIGALDTDAVVGWVFGSEAKGAWKAAFPWELLRTAVASGPADMSVDGGEVGSGPVLSVLKGFKGAAADAISGEAEERAQESELVLGQLRAFSRRQAPVEDAVSEKVRAEFEDVVDARIRMAVMEGLGFSDLM